MDDKQLTRLKQLISEFNINNQSNTSPKEDLYNSIDQSLNNDYNMPYNEFADVIAKYFNDYYGEHLKENFLKILNDKID